jgi:hypothetical protein
VLCSSRLVLPGGRPRLGCATGATDCIIDGKSNDLNEDEASFGSLFSLWSPPTTPLCALPIGDEAKTAAAATALKEEDRRDLVSERLLNVTMLLLPISAPSRLGDTHIARLLAC